MIDFLAVSGVSIYHEYLKPQMFAFFLFVSVMKIIWWISKTRLLRNRILIRDSPALEYELEFVSDLSTEAVPGLIDNGLIGRDLIDDCLVANEQWHLVELLDGNRYIGLVLEVVDELNGLVLCVDLLMSAREFYRFPLNIVKRYLVDLASEDEDALVLASHIERLVADQTYFDIYSPVSVVQTHWIRIIQRKWRNLLARRQNILRSRGRPDLQRRFELTGKYGVRVPGIRGMLNTITCSELANTKTD